MENIEGYILSDKLLKKYILYWGQWKYWQKKLESIRTTVKSYALKYIMQIYALSWEQLAAWEFDTMAVKYIIISLQYIHINIYEGVQVYMHN